MLGILSIGSVIYISFLVPRLLNHILFKSHLKYHAPLMYATSIPIIPIS